METLEDNKQEFLDFAATERDLFNAFQNEEGAKGAIEALKKTTEEALQQTV